MIEGHDHHQSKAGSDPLATALFQQQWQAYRKIMKITTRFIARRTAPFARF
jgi:hypothetical protein